MPMLADGNSSPDATSWCLLNTLRGEVPFRREMGIAPEVFDLPFEEARTALDDAARNALADYEPRVDVAEVEIEASEEESAGGAPYTVRISDTDTDDYDLEERG